MGMARQNRVAAWASRQREVRRAARSRGIPVPGTGVRHFHRSPSGARNPNGATQRPNREWGRKARKWEDHHSIIPAQAEADSIAEGLDEYHDSLYGVYHEYEEIDREED